MNGRENLMSNLTARQHALVGIGASLASHCIPCIKYHVRMGQRAGLSDEEIRGAIELAEKVDQVPARNVREAAIAALSGGGDRTSNTDRRSACNDRGAAPQSGHTAAPSCCGEADQ